MFRFPVLLKKDYTSPTYIRRTSKRHMLLLLQIILGSPLLCVFLFYHPPFSHKEDPLLITGNPQPLLIFSLCPIKPLYGSEEVFEPFPPLLGQVLNSI